MFDIFKQSTPAPLVLKGVQEICKMDNVPSAVPELGDRHVGHQVAIVRARQWCWPSAYDDLPRSKRAKNSTAGNNWTEGSTLLLEGEQASGERVVVLRLFHHCLVYLPLALGLNQPGRLLIRNA